MTIVDFTHDNTNLSVDRFYDGRIRFLMKNYRTMENCAVLMEVEELRDFVGYLNRWIEDEDNGEHEGY